MSMNRLSVTNAKNSLETMFSILMHVIQNTDNHNARDYDSCLYISESYFFIYPNINIL